MIQIPGSWRIEVRPDTAKLTHVIVTALEIDVIWSEEVRCSSKIKPIFRAEWEVSDANNNLFMHTSVKRTEYDSVRWLSTWFSRWSGCPVFSALSSRSGSAARSARTSERQLDGQRRIAVLQSTADLHLTLAVWVLPPLNIGHVSTIRHWRLPHLNHAATPWLWVGFHSGLYTPI